ncbi:MAG: 30S ribosome-binding factor RbfA [Gammaproteobacteria bacterium]
MAKGFKREQRINDLIQTALAEIILREAKDMRFGMITITGVNVAHDLSHAKVFVSVLDEEKAKETLVALNNAAKYLRYALANAVELRVTPELKFVYDDSCLRGSRISSLINDALKK